MITEQLTPAERRVHERNCERIVELLEGGATLENYDKDATKNRCATGCGRKADKRGLCRACRSTNVMTTKENEP